MIISSEQVKKLLLELLNSAPFKGEHAEFISAVKREVSTATVESALKVVESEPQDCTASARMMEHK